jgi:uncharacterized membrane protein
MNRHTWTLPPLGAALLLFCLLFAGRVFITGSLFYAFLFWNLFLAWLPLLFSRWMHRSGREGSVRWWLALCGWLLFFPNAPYIITDLKHLSHTRGVPPWYDATLVFVAALLGLYMGLLSLRRVELQWRRRYTGWMQHLFVPAVLLLTGYGMYLGRFGRFNSWDVLTNPARLAATVADHWVFPWEHKGVWAISLLFAAVCQVAYMLFASQRHLRT